MAHAALHTKRTALTNTATLAVTLLVMAALDLYFVAQQKQPAGSPERFYASGKGEFPPPLEYSPGSSEPSTERARRLFALWGEWRLGRIGARQIVLYDPSATAARVFPTPPWLGRNDKAQDPASGMSE